MEKHGHTKLELSSLRKFTATVIEDVISTVTGNYVVRSKRDGMQFSFTQCKDMIVYKALNIINLMNFGSFLIMIMKRFK